MAKTNTAETEEKHESGDAPLIDLNEAQLKKLIARAKKRGYITYDELNDALPQDQMSSEQIEDVMSALVEMGVNIVENEEADEEDEAEGGRQRPPRRWTAASRPSSLEKKKETVDRTDDPVRMYLREMGAVELLTREGEIAIAKRIEAGRDTMIWGLCESPITFNAIIDWSNALNNGADAAARDPRPRGDALQGPDPRAGRGRRGRRTTARSPRGPPAPPSRRRKRSRTPPPRRRTRTATWSSAARRARSRRRTRTTRSASPRWRRR